MKNGIGVKWSVPDNILSNSICDKNRATVFEGIE